MDNENVQKGASSEGEVSQSAVDQTANVPLTPEAFNAAIAEATAKAAAEAAAAVRREIQSVKDKSIAEVQRALHRAQTAESIIGTLRSDNRIDEETQRELELIEARAKAQQYDSLEAQQAAKAQMEAFETTFTTQMNQFITDLGVDPTDKRIDWGSDAGDYLAKQQRILASVGKIQKDTVKAEAAKRSQEIKEVESRLRRELGLDSVDTTNTVARAAKSEDERLKGRYPTMAKK